MNIRRIAAKSLAVILAAATAVSASVTGFAEANVLENAPETTALFNEDGLRIFNKNVQPTDIPQYIRIEEGESSKYGLTPVKYFTEDGEEVALDLTVDEPIDYAASLPSRFNLKEQGRDSSVGNQGSYGVCWTFATTTAMETNAITQGMANTSVNYSERHISWYVYGASTPDQNDPLYGDNGNYGTAAYNMGGHVLHASACLASWMGPEMESAVPFSTSTALDESYRYKSYSHLQNMIMYDFSDISGIKQAVYDNGSAWLSYSHHDEYFNYSTNAYYVPTTLSDSVFAEGAHAVSIVGWDDNYSASNFNTAPPANGAWIVKNSWGTSWGDSGYYYMSYYDCSGEEASSFLVENTNNYGDIYQWDGDNSGWVSGVDCYANVFTARETTTLDAISFMSMSVDTAYTVKVYTNVTDTPDSGTLATTQTVTYANAGYHTLDLTNDVKITNGQKFAVTVEGDGLLMCIDSNNYAAGTSYYFGGYSWVDLNDYGFGNVCIKAFTKAASLAAPANVKASSASDGIKLTWDAVSGATSYRIYRADSSTGTKTELKTVGPTSCTDTTAAYSKTYYYFVAAYSSSTGALSPYSTAVSATRTMTLAQPVISSVTFKNETVTVAWNSVSNATSYKVYRATSLDGTRTLLKTVGTTSCTDTPASGTYYYFIQAYNSTAKVLSASSAGKGISILKKPVIQSITCKDDVVTITWNAVNTATSYKVYRATSLDGTRTLLKTVGTNSCTDTPKSGTYYYFIQAYNSNAKVLSASSAGKSVSLITKPVIQSITASSSSVTLKWNTVNTATSYKVYRATSATGTRTLLKTVGITSYTDTTAKAGVNYYYFVQAYNSNLKILSASSNPKSICILTKPQITALVDANGCLTVKWNAVNTATSYRVYRATSPTGAKTLIKTTSALSFSDYDVESGQLYYYFIQAYNSTNNLLSPTSSYFYDRKD